MITGFHGGKTTPRRLAKEYTLRMLEAFCQEWDECHDEHTGDPLCEGMTEREKIAVDQQLRKITQQFSKYHGIPLFEEEEEDQSWYMDSRA